MGNYGYSWVILEELIRTSVNMTVKWDGDPAIFADVKPETGDFFVAKKSVFNVNPKLYIKGGKNLHLEHLEDEILNYGVDDDLTPTSPLYLNRL